MSEVIYPRSQRLEEIANAWETHGHKPSIIESTSVGEESVWDYPRPPSIQINNSHIIVKVKNKVILDTTRSIRICEKASAPTYYFWKEDFKADFIQTDHTSYCEWKGHGTYWSIKTDDELLKNAAWSYETPYDEYQLIEGLVGFYPAHFETYLEGEKVRPQAGGFYAGWVTHNIKGPIKGELGSRNW